MADNLNTVLDSGLDAFVNLYDVVVTFPSSVTGLLYASANAGLVSVRTGDVTLPNLKGNTYTVDYKGIQLTRLGSKIEGERSIQIPFRIDADQKLLADFYKWKHLWVNPNTSEITFGAYSNTTTDAAKYGKIVVKTFSALSKLSSTVDSTATGIRTWEFKDVVLSDVAPPQLSRAGSDAMVVTCTFLFGNYVEPV